MTPNAHVLALLHHEFASTVIRFPTPLPHTGHRPPGSATLQEQLERLLAWCRARSGPEATQDNPTGTWCCSRLDASSVVITAPNELIFELHMVEPWRSP